MMFTVSVLNVTLLVIISVMILSFIIAIYYCYLSLLLLYIIYHY